MSGTVNSLRRYIIPILLERQKGVCAICKKSHKEYDIDHKVYNPMETINELQLLCIPCHHEKTDYTHLSGKY
jgi:5-methylcytosine-specific restriction endonuclease McrA